MSGDIVARRYARALFALGKKKGLPELEKLGSDLSALNAAVSSSSELLQLYKNPLFGVGEKLKVTEAILDELKASDYTRNFCRLLAEKGRLVTLPDITVGFGELLDAEKGIIRGELVTAVELNETKRKTVLEELNKQVKQTLELIYSVNPDLLGGVLLKVGDQVLDASLRAQLSILKENIKRGV